MRSTVGSATGDIPCQSAFLPGVRVLYAPRLNQHLLSCLPVPLDDEVTPRGMGVRFLEISAEDRRFIAEVLDAHTLSKLATEYLQTLEKDRGMN